MSGEWKSLWPLRGQRKWDKMKKNPLLQKIIRSLPQASVSEVTSCKSHNKSSRHKIRWEEKGTSCCTMFNGSIWIMLSLKISLLLPKSNKILVDIDCHLSISILNQWSLHRLIGRDDQMKQNIQDSFLGSSVLRTNGVLSPDWRH